MGYFFVMLVFMSLAILFARRKIAWIFYIVGAVLQGMSLLGLQKQANMLSFMRIRVPWGAYIIILLVTAFIVGYRYSNAPVTKTTVINDKFWTCKKCGKDNLTKYSQCQNCGALKETQWKAPTEKIAKDWICANCGTENSMNYFQCKKCGQYKS